MRTVKCYGGVSLHTHIYIFIYILVAIADIMLPSSHQ
jgi:hypothetical protein